MLFRLCGYVSERRGVEQIDISEYEEDIIQTLGECMSRNPDAGYSITIITEEQHIPYQTIYSFQDYINYLEEYEAMNKERTKILVKSKLK